MSDKKGTTYTVGGQSLGNVEMVQGEVELVDSGGDVCWSQDASGFDNPTKIWMGSEETGWKVYNWDKEIEAWVYAPDELPIIHLKPLEAE